MTPEQIIKELNMKPHPEGGFYAETFRDADNLCTNARAASTAIYYLLLKGQKSHWHRVDAAEVWHFYAGSPLQLSLAKDSEKVREATLGTTLLGGARPQIVVKKGEWQSAISLGAWSLVGCTVAPGFEFAGFEMAPESWSPA